ncbi:hypothetical protein NLJ89_g7039 [Agrocybe chaxingu]|uniref:DUF6534 domain-containing protein n=1 Tax=Agrocybe chaxingu TaxID=84603 RepID=A0A9W8MVU6_9AGAR|nr:hypothetical protein NLJ89_g7039 [Agrocybe chaxingu]
MAKGPAEFAHGWMFVGFFINCLLMGMMTLQVYNYYVTYKKDKLWIKIFVAVLFLADVYNTMIIFWYLYRTLITFFGDVDNLIRTDWLFASEPASTGVIATAVQLFFAWRIQVLTKSLINALVIASLAITAGVCSIITGYEVGRRETFASFASYKHVVIIWLVTSVLCDIMITALLVFYFPSQRKHKTGFQRSDMMIDRIIRVAVQTGLLTMIVATADLIVYLADPTGTHLMLNYPLSKLYSNSLMSSLNSRRGWKYDESANTDTDPVITTGNIKQHNIQITSMKDTEARTHPEVFVHVESHELRDVKPNDLEYTSKRRSLAP